MQACDQVTQGRRVLRNQGLHGPRLQLGRIQARSEQRYRQLHGVGGHHLDVIGAAVSAQGPLTAPRAAWPVVAFGWGVRRVVLKPDGRARQAILTMDPHTWQHGAGREIVHPDGQLTLGRRKLSQDERDHGRDQGQQDRGQDERRGGGAEQLPPCASQWLAGS